MVIVPLSSDPAEEELLQAVRLVTASAATASAATGARFRDTILALHRRGSWVGVAMVSSAGEGVCIPPVSLISSASRRTHP
jgi:hypothetical protein